MSKSDVRVSNPGLSVGGLGLAHGLSPYGYGHAGIGQVGLAHPGLSPLSLAHGHIASPLALQHRLAAPIGVAPGLLGVAYSVAPAVSHMSYSNGLGLTYSW